jgi:hypothetical protein
MSHFNGVSFFDLIGPPGVDVGDGITEEMSCECCSDHTAVLTALPFHQHVVVQQGGNITHQSTSTAAPQCVLLHQGLGSETEVKIGAVRSVGRTAGAGTGRRLPSGSNYTSSTSFAGTVTDSY